MRDSRTRTDVRCPATYLNTAASNRQVLIAGFTDAKATCDHNLGLSRRCAVVGREALVEAGVDRHRLAADGLKQTPAGHLQQVRTPSAGRTTERSMTGSAGKTGGSSRGCCHDRDGEQGLRPVAPDSPGRGDDASRRNYGGTGPSEAGVTRL